MKSKLLPALAALIAVSVGIVLVSRGNDGEPSTTVAPTEPPSQSTATPPAGKATVIWTEVTPAQTANVPMGSKFLLDTETGKMYSSTDLAPEDGASYFAWIGNSLLVGIYERDANTQVWYVGEALGPVIPIPGNTPLLSVRGISLSHRDSMVDLYDVETQQEIQKIPLPANYVPGAWSPSGKYLTLERHFDYSRRDEPAVLIWDIDQAQVVLSLPKAGNVLWAHFSDRFVYSVMEVVNGEVVSRESRLNDIQTGADSAISIRWISGWSPDDRYLTGSPLPPQGEAFSVLDSRDGRVLATLRGAWPMRWIDVDTISFIADLCTNASDLYYMNADGSELRKVPGFANVLAHPSADGTRLAHNIWGDGTRANLVRVVDLTSGWERVFDVGRTYLLPYPGTSDLVWSSDGRILILTAPMGKDGPCMGEHIEPFQLIRHP